MRLALRQQLMIVALVALAIPLAGWQFARQVEQSLRDHHALGLKDNAAAIAQRLAEEFPDAWPAPGHPVLYVHQTATPIWLDGFADDWTAWAEPFQQLQSNDGQLQLALTAARYQSELYLLFQVNSPQQIFRQPGQTAGDQIALRAANENRKGELVIAPLAPGWLEARGDQPGGWPRVQGVWQSRSQGWTLELQLPDRPVPQTLAFEVRDFDQIAPSGQPGPDRTLGSLDQAWTLVSRQAAMTERLAELAPSDSLAWASLPSGWVLASSDRRAPPPSEARDRPAPASWLDTLLFERLLSGRLPTGQPRDASLARLEGAEIGHDHAASQWTSRSGDPGIMLSVSAPVRVQGQTVGAVVLTRDADALLLASNRAVLRLLGTSLGALMLMALVLLGFAALLSERIRRLRNQAEAAVGSDGRVQAMIRPPRASDELGDLGRSMASLLGRLREHQDYLRTLADKLAHELRTPLAMIRSSLDNLEHANDPADIQRYCQRANEGSVRLNRIFQAMSQAARIEDSIRSETVETFDLSKLLTNYLDACRETYPDRTFSLVLPAPQACPVEGSPELLAQLLDKLIDNAVDFSPAGSRIDLELKRQRDALALTVFNPGPPLPEGSTERLFESMVSARQEKSDQVHLGLGLAIARLIADFHGGQLTAANWHNGVRFSLRLPA